VPPLTGGAAPVPHRRAAPGAGPPSLRPSTRAQPKLLGTTKTKTKKSGPGPSISGRTSPGSCSSSCCHCESPSLVTLSPGPRPRKSRPQLLPLMELPPWAHQLPACGSPGAPLAFTTRSRAAENGRPRPRPPPLRLLPTHRRQLYQLALFPGGFPGASMEAGRASGGGRYTACAILATTCWLRVGRRKRTVGTLRREPRGACSMESSGRCVTRLLLVAVQEGKRGLVGRRGSECCAFSRTSATTGGLEGPSALLRKCDRGQPCKEIDTAAKIHQEPLRS